MKEVLNSILNRLNNKGTILALASLVISLIVQFGVEIDSEKVMGIVTTVCTILVSLGILNNPVDNKDVYVPYVKDQLVEKNSTLPSDDVKKEINN